MGKGRLAAQIVLLAVGTMAIPAGVLGSRPIRVQIPEAREGSVPHGDSSAAVPLDSLTAMVVERDLFRVGRSPADMAFQLMPLELVPVDPPPPKPQLLLSGIVWEDEEPTALIEGLPGVDGVRVMKTGDSAGSIRVKGITRTDVTLTGMDTTWVLQVRKPW